MKKVKLELDELEVVTFAIQGAKDETEGTVMAHSTPEGCYTIYIGPNCRPPTANPDYCD